MVYGFVIAIHVISCLILILVILLQAGRGGGLSEAFGGASSQTIFGAKTNVFLARATATAAIMFLVTCLLLGILTSRRGRSLIQLKGPLMEGQTLPFALPQSETKEGETLDEAKQGLPDAEPQQAPSK